MHNVVRCQKRIQNFSSCQIYSFYVEYFIAYHQKPFRNKTAFKHKLFNSLFHKLYHFFKIICINKKPQMLCFLHTPLNDYSKLLCFLFSVEFGHKYVIPIPVIDNDDDHIECEISAFFEAGSLESSVKYLRERKVVYIDNKVGL